MREKLVIKSDLYSHSQIKNPEIKELKVALAKVCVSMARLLTVINERNKLKNEFLQLLEFWYISVQRNEVPMENKKIEVNQKERVKELGFRLKRKKISSNMELNQVIAEKLLRPEVAMQETLAKKKLERAQRKSKIDETKHNALNEITLYNKVETDVNNENTTPKTENKQNSDQEVTKVSTQKETKVSTPKESNSTEVMKKENPFKDFTRILTKEEERMVNSLERRYSNKALVSRYIKNSHILKGDERRKVISKINADRASHAKHIFMKEMAAISYVLKNSTKQTVTPDI